MSASRHPGEVYQLPPGVAEPTDTKQRRHLLVSHNSDTDTAAVVAYSSTRDTEARLGKGAHVTIDPFSDEYGTDRGFDEITLVYLCRLRSVLTRHVRDCRGRVIDEMPEVRRVLASSLGLGMGTARAGLAAGSFRGQLVRFTPATQQKTLTPWGVIVTEPYYSLRRRYQHVLPIYVFKSLSMLRRGDLIVEEREWLNGIEASQVLISAENLFSPFLGNPAEAPTKDYQPEIEALSTQVIDRATMDEIDQTLRLYFDL
jgi:hypothetical protein